jgi:hypothetical protein
MWNVTIARALIGGLELSDPSSRHTSSVDANAAAFIALRGLAMKGLLKKLNLQL